MKLVLVAVAVVYVAAIVLWHVFSEGRVIA
jgi:hypothetical protein